MKPMTVIEIVRDCIEKNGFDGLFNLDGDCACELDDIAPCGHLGEDCTMGYRYWCDGDEGCEYYGEGRHWHMREKK